MLTAGIVFITVAGLAIAAGAVVLLFAAWRAPEGYQSKDGFHAITRDGMATPQASSPTEHSAPGISPIAALEKAQ